MLRIADDGSAQELPDALEFVKFRWVGGWVVARCGVLWRAVLCCGVLRCAECVKFRWASQRAWTPRVPRAPNPRCPRPLSSLASCLAWTHDGLGFFYNRWALLVISCDMI